jgi:hypothetical protein
LIVEARDPHLTGMVCDAEVEDESIVGFGEGEVAFFTSPFIVHFDYFFVTAFVVASWVAEHCSFDVGHACYQGKVIRLISFTYFFV